MRAARPLVASAMTWESQYAARTADRLHRSVAVLLLIYLRLPVYFLLHSLSLSYHARISQHLPLALEPSFHAAFALLFVPLLRDSSCNNNLMVMITAYESTCCN